MDGHGFSLAYEGMTGLRLRFVREDDGRLRFMPHDSVSAACLEIGPLATAFAAELRFNQVSDPSLFKGCLDALLRRAARLPRMAAEPSLPAGLESRTARLFRAVCRTAGNDETRITIELPTGMTRGRALGVRSSAWNAALDAIADMLPQQQVVLASRDGPLKLRGPRIEIDLPRTNGPKAREAACDEVVSAAAELGLSGIRILRLLPAAILKRLERMRCAGSAPKAYAQIVARIEQEDRSNTKPAAVPRRRAASTAPRRPDLRKLLAHIAGATNDGRACGFDPDIYGRPPGNPLGWEDLRTFSAGQCWAFADALHAMTEWPLVVELIQTTDELQRGGADLTALSDAHIVEWIFGKNIPVHVWAINPRGRAVDIFGERDGPWAATAIAKRHPHGHVVPIAPNIVRRFSGPRERKRATAILREHRAFYGIPDIRRSGAV